MADERDDQVTAEAAGEPPEDRIPVYGAGAGGTPPPVMTVPPGVDPDDEYAWHTGINRPTGVPDAVEFIEVHKAFSPGPAIVQELLFKTARARIGIAEVPIEFLNRAAGTSTLTFRKLLQGYWAVLKLRWMAMRGQL